MASSQPLPSLFCKPDLQAQNRECLYQRFIPGIQQTFRIRSFRLSSDTDMIHDWVNQEYAKRFWQMDGPRNKVYDSYNAIQHDSHSHSFIGMLDKRPVCQVDLYQVLSDEIQQYVKAGPDDCGMHLLMAPLRQYIKELTYHTLQSFLAYYFSFDEAKRLFGEPDVHNDKANLLIQRVGFRYRKTVCLSYKTANLYCCTRNSFFKHFSSPN